LSLAVFGVIGRTAHTDHHGGQRNRFFAAHPSLSPVSTQVLITALITGRQWVQKRWRSSLRWWPRGVPSRELRCHV